MAESDIKEILSSEYSEDMVYSVYRHCMEKCGWEPSSLEEGSIRDLCLCLLFKDEVDGGGLAAFFYNYAGDMAHETLEALNKVDEGSAKLLAEGIKCFPRGIVPKDIDKRNVLFNRLSGRDEAKMEKLSGVVIDDSFCRKCYDFIMAHKGDFLCF